MGAFKRAIELDRGNIEAVRALGIAYQQRGAHAQSMAALTAIIDRNPADGHAYFLRALSRNRLRERAGALSDMTRACELDHANACELKRRATPS